MIDTSLEIRHIELRASTDPNSRTITGTAIVFNSLSEPLGEKGEFRELLLPSAITQELINNSDIVCLYNHDQAPGVLARWNKGRGSLKVTLTSTGVDFSFNAKKTALGDEILESVRNGDISAMSFAFKKSEGGDNWKRQNDGTYLRTITSIALLKDFSFVVDPAYKSTSCDLRGLDELRLSETNIPIEDMNTCEGCTKCDEIFAQNAKILELVTKLAITEIIEEIAEVIEPVEPVLEVKSVDEAPVEDVPVVDSTPATVDEDEELRNYYIALKTNILTIKLE